MPNALALQLDALAKDFARELTAAIRASNMDDITSLAVMKEAVSSLPVAVVRAIKIRPEEIGEAPAKRGRGRPPKGTSDTVSQLGGVIDYVKAHPGCSGEAARKALGLPKTQWNTLVLKALQGGKLRKAGERRGTKYWAT